MKLFKKHKVLYGVIIVLIVAVIGAAWALSARTFNHEMIGGYDMAVYRYKTDYVGDASKMGNLTSNLPYGDHKSGISLKTNAEPYQINVNYVVTADEFNVIKSDGSVPFKNAAVIFCLTGNVSTVSLRFDDGTNINSYTFDRADIDKVFGGDVRGYSASYSKFKNEFLSALSNINVGLHNFTPVSVPKEATLYVWKGGPTGGNEVNYTLVPGPDTADYETIFDAKNATGDLAEINKKLEAYEGATSLSIRHTMDFTKEEMVTLSNKIAFPGTSISMGVFGEEGNDVPAKVEENLKIIMSSPLVSSNTNDYIKAHKKEYDEIVAMGDGAVDYMFSLFKKGNENGLKGNIMMSLCKEILGDKIAKVPGPFKTSEDWYEKTAQYLGKK